MAVDVAQSNGALTDLAYLRAPERFSTDPILGESIAIVDLFSGCGGMTLGALEGARRTGRPAELKLAVDQWAPALEVVELTLELDDAQTCQLDLTALLKETGHPARNDTEDALQSAGADTTLLLAGPPCQGHSALNNHTRHDDARNDLYRAVAEVAAILKPRAVIVENVRGVRRDRRDAVKRCLHELNALGYAVRPRLIDIHALGAPQRRVRHVLVATNGRPFDFDQLINQPGRTVSWAIADLEGRHGETLFDTASVPTADNEARIDYLFDHNIDNLPNQERPMCHRSDHSYVSMYGRLAWGQPAQTVTSGFGSMGQGRFVHPLARRTLTPHEAARLQFLPDFMDFSLVETRRQLAAMIGNAVPPILIIALVRALIEQELL